MITSIPSKASEDDIYNFLKENNIENIRDIQIVKDSQTGRSKGIGFVEFYTEDNLNDILSLNKRVFMGNSLGVVETKSERNRGHIKARSDK